MVRDGYYYALAMLVAALVLGELTTAWVAIFPLLLGAFLLWFFRDPERAVPSEPGAVVSPADGKVTDVVAFEQNGLEFTRVSIFLNVFNVHVNRSPIAGIIREVEYKTGKFGNAMGTTSAGLNEQNIITVEGEGKTIIFKQIAGLLARRIVFKKKIGDAVARGERIGMIKFGSRCDVVLDRAAELRVRAGEHVKGGSSVLAILLPKESA